MELRKVFYSNIKITAVRESEFLPEKHTIFEITADITEGGKTEINVRRLLMIDALSKAMMRGFLYE